GSRTTVAQIHSPPEKHGITWARSIRKILLSPRCRNRARCRAAARQRSPSLPAKHGATAVHSAKMAESTADREPAEPACRSQMDRRDARAAGAAHDLRP